MFIWMDGVSLLGGPVESYQLLYNFLDCKCLVVDTQIKLNSVALEGYCEI